jgi:hypothetical protein
MRIYYILIFILVAVLYCLPVSSLSAQERSSISGIVSDSVSGDPLPGVNIILSGTERGTSTDTDGYFEFRDIPPGKVQFRFSYIGYKTLEISIDVTGGEVSDIQIALSQSAVILDEIEVRASRFRQLQADTRTSVLQLRPENARILPGAGEDVFRTLQALPGILTRSDFSSQLVIRGGGPDQNLIVMDDIEVFNPYRLYGLISMFNPETVADINLITGGYPAIYGDRLSAVLDVSNRDGFGGRAINGSINTSITNANIVLEGELPFEAGGSWLISGRRTYYDLIAGPIARNAGLVQDDVAFPNFTDLQTRFNFGPYNGHRIIINTLHSRDAVNIISGEDRSFPDSVAVTDQTDHSVAGIAWHYSPNNNFYSKLVLSNYRNTGDSDFEGRFLDPSLDRDNFIGPILDSTGVRLFEFGISSLYDFQKTSVLGDITYAPEPSHELRIGAGVDFLTTRLIWSAELGQSFRDFLESFDVPFIDEFTQKRNYARVFGYIQDNWKVSRRLTLHPGIRIDHYEILSGTYASPRLSASYAIDRHSTVRTSIGRYLQSPGYEKIFGQTQFFDLTDREAMSTLKPEEAYHYVAGIDRWFTPSIYVRVESYVKDYINLISLERRPGIRYIADPVAGADQRFIEGWSEPYAVPIDSFTIIPNNDASGSAYGFEFFLEKRQMGESDRLSGWISYAYARADRKQYGTVLPFDFDQRHTLNVVMHYRLSSSWEIGARWRYGSGFPHTPPVGIRPRIAYAEDEGERIPVIQTDQRGYVIFNIDRGDYTNRNSERLPAYSRIDVRLNWYTQFWGVRWLFYLDVINILNHKNIIGYSYAIDDKLRLSARPSSMFPIIPTLGISFRF